MLGVKSSLIQRIVEPYSNGAQKLSAFGRKFARILSSWVLQRQYSNVRKPMYIGRSSVPVMLAQPASLIEEEGGAQIAIFALGEFFFIIKDNRNCFGT